ncbi:hypothetical protein [Thermosulfurimonas sp. F29]|uniref:hypothetical protein n=1 Tax=Thermosulfurimonas sp. F29 TaxID=2867247 RepID=UPI001C8309BA|nr:hypothetical protein [Thermosulfurimonas sp. F29]MBX6423375.1 hypothetical protein [Thermosulfurimonas sp. F29]
MSAEADCGKAEEKNESAADCASFVASDDSGSSGVEDCSTECGDVVSASTSGDTDDAFGTTNDAVVTGKAEEGNGCVTEGAAGDVSAVVDCRKRETVKRIKQVIEAWERSAQELLEKNLEKERKRQEAKKRDKSEILREAFFELYGANLDKEDEEVRSLQELYETLQELKEARPDTLDKRYRTTRKYIEIRNRLHKYLLDAELGYPDVFREGENRIVHHIQHLIILGEPLMKYYEFHVHQVLNFWRGIVERAKREGDRAFEIVYSQSIKELEELWQQFREARQEAFKAWEEWGRRRAHPWQQLRWAWKNRAEDFKKHPGLAKFYEEWVRAHQEDLQQEFWFWVFWSIDRLYTVNDDLIEQRLGVEHGRIHFQILDEYKKSLRTVEVCEDTPREEDEEEHHEKVVPRIERDEVMERELLELLFRWDRESFRVFFRLAYERAEEENARVANVLRKHFYEVLDAEGVLDREAWKKLKQLVREEPIATVAALDYAAVRLHPMLANSRYWTEKVRENPVLLVELLEQFYELRGTVSPGEMKIFADKRPERRGGDDGRDDQHQHASAS